jgi:triphosphatase
MPALRLHVEDGAGEAFSTLLLIHHAHAAAAAALAAEGDPEGVHDLRVALRRLRALMRVFRRLARARNLLRWRAQAGALTRRFGAARDEDVWAGYLDGWAASGSLTAGLAEYRARVRRRQMRLYKALRGTLGSAAYRDFMHAVAAAAEREPGSTGAAVEPIRCFAARALRRRLGKVLGLRADEESAQALHHLRRKLRALRYRTEFFAPVLGAPVERLAALLKQATDALGTVHDMDVGLLRCCREHAPPVVATLAGRERSRALVALHVCWKQLQRPSLRQRLRGLLKRVRKEYAGRAH